MSVHDVCITGIIDIQETLQIKVPYDISWKHVEIEKTPKKFWGSPNVGTFKGEVGDRKHRRNYLGRNNIILETKRRKSVSTNK